MASSAFPRPNNSPTPTSSSCTRKTPAPFRPHNALYLDAFLFGPNAAAASVVIHDAIASDDPDWFKTIVGGAWAYGRAGFFEGDISFYYLDHTDPITRDASNFDFDDEMYYHAST